MAYFAIDITSPSFGNIANMIAAVAAAIGLLLTARNLRIGNFQRRVRIVSVALSSLYEDEEISKIYYQLEYSKFKYDDSRFHGSDNERRLDRLLAKLNLLAREHEIGLVETADLAIMRYEYLVVYRDKEVQKYLKYLDRWFETTNATTPPFHSFRRLGEILSAEGATNTRQKVWFKTRGRRPASTAVSAVEG